MESQRSLLFVALMVVTYLLFTQWQMDNAPVIEPSTLTQTTVPQSSESDFVPESSSLEPTQTEVHVANEQIIDISTDVLALKINTRGGDIVEAKLLTFETEQDSNIPFTVMQNGTLKYIAQSGLIGEHGIDKTVPGRPIYQSIKQTYHQTDDTPLIVDLTYKTESGLTIIKRFTLNKSSYSIALDYIVKNNTAEPANVQLYAQLKQSTLVESGSTLMPTYRGAAYSTKEDRYNKYDFDDIADKNLAVTTEGGWVAMLEHYFVSSWVPNKTDLNEIYTSYSSNQEAIIGFKAPLLTVAPADQAVTSTVFYVGPKDQHELDKIADDLGLTIDYGFLWMISKPLHGLLTAIQSGEFELFGFSFDFGGVGNWGIAIIMITLVVKGGMYPLTKAQYTSMARMRELQPKMTQLKERFGDDRQKMSQAMMELYKKEKVNPAGGCLPLLIQMPIFLALYWVFLESVELRHAPFALWIQDLSSQDPFYVLPVLMGISMFIMQKMQPMTVQDPMQQKIMQYMPVMFTVFFFWFPSGLVLYWLVSNIISIVQMKIIFSGIEKKKQQ